MSREEVRNEIEFGARLQARRRALGLTQAEVAERASVSRAFVINLESGGHTRAEFGRVLAVVRALDLVIALNETQPVAFDDALARLLGGGS
ncbi:MAG: helix-turn-helix transcriptional regulator [Actinobacteria bacterium]|nr:helix-turn-helix transcriptional regulator [Actinomycetota bacterium]MCG2798590.1 helix-turn-helix transcriptional regulator [Cellulomonas sp.]